MPYVQQLQVQNNTLSLVPGNAVELPGGGGNVADWAQDPAVTSINANGNGLNNAGSVAFVPSGTLTSDGTQLLFNGSPVGGGGGPPTTWSQYPATQAVFSSAGPLSLGTAANGTVINGTTTLVNTEDLLITADAGLNIINTADISLIAQNGYYGNINIEANSGEDIPLPPIAGSVGGLVNIQANSGTSILQGLSRVNVEAATVSIEAGALGSLAYVPGSVNLLSGLGTGIQILTSVGVINIASGVAATLSAGAGVYFDGATQGVNVAAGQSLFVDKVEPRTSPGTVGIPELNIASPNASITFGTSGDQITAAVNPAGSFTSINGVNTSSAGPSLVVDDLTAPFLQTTLLTATDASIVGTLETDATGKIKTNTIEPATGGTATNITAVTTTSLNGVTIGNLGPVLTVTDLKVTEFQPTNTLSLGSLKIFNLGSLEVNKIIPYSGGTVSIPTLNIASPDSSITFGTSGDQITAVVPKPKQATYYKSVVQNLIAGSTDITFDLTGAWNNVGGYITHVNGTADFTVVTTGLYQLEFHAAVLLNNGTWGTAGAFANKIVSIDITRSPGGEEVVIANAALQGTQNYTMFVVGTQYLVAGDVINNRVFNLYSAGTPTPPQANCLTDVFDLNTYFSWTYISS